jgi:hypothetical protein
MHAWLERQSMRTATESVAGCRPVSNDSIYLLRVLPRSRQERSELAAPIAFASHATRRQTRAGNS